MLVSGGRHGFKRYVLGDDRSEIAEEEAAGPLAALWPTVLDADVQTLNTEALDAEEAAVVIASTAPSPRAIPPEEIARVAEEMGASAIVEADIGSAIDRAKRLAGPTDAVLITGSLWFIGAARSALVSGP